MLLSCGLQRTQYSTVILASLHRWRDFNDFSALIEKYYLCNIISSLTYDVQCIVQWPRLWWSCSWTCKRNTAVVWYKLQWDRLMLFTPFRWSSSLSVIECWRNLSSFSWPIYLQVLACWRSPQSTRGNRRAGTRSWGSCPICCSWSPSWPGNLSLNCLSGNNPSSLVSILTSVIPRKSIHQLVAVMDPRTTQGDSLLHLSVSKSNTLKTQVPEDKPTIHL